MLTAIITVMHVLICITIIVVILLQSGKGSDLGAVFGGGSSQTLFGSSGSATFLSKLTTAGAIAFMLTSLLLAYLSMGRAGDSSVLDDVESGSAVLEQTQPATDDALADVDQPAETAQPEAADESGDVQVQELIVDEVVVEQGDQPAESPTEAVEGSSEQPQDSVAEPAEPAGE
ncbi:MAG: preprotein translocase subunit SecG [Candidatus Alcyoniella australis]|nr:preprotein translocase subunit SecG [Candidatus Alcyoniella australis]